MANKIYQLTYDTVLDKDIDDWLKSLPRNRKAELVRNAIRAHIHGASGVFVPSTHQEQDPLEKGQPIRKRGSKKLLEN